MTIVMRTVRPTVVLKRPRPVGWGKGFVSFDFKWREFASRKEHVIGLASGMEVPDKFVRYFWDRHKHVTATAKYLALTGQSASDFWVYKDGKLIGRGFLPPRVALQEIAYFFVALKRVSGCDGYLGWYPSGRKWVDEDAPYRNPLFDLFAEESRPMPTAKNTWLDVSFAHMERDGGGKLLDEPQREHLSIRPGDTMPQEYAAMFYARRAAYERVLAECSPQCFRVYNANFTCDGPTPIWEVRADGCYWQIGEIVDPVSNRGYFAEGHGLFDRTPSASKLAFLSCKLAARDRWLVLVPSERDKFSADVLALMAGLDNGAELLNSEVQIRPTVAGPR